MPLGEGAAAMAAGMDFALPDEVLAALPRDPYEQLDLARRITALAVAGRVSGLEREAGRLRADAAEKDRENAELRERVGLLDTALQETNARLRAALEDNIKLSKERDSLAQTTKKLARDLQKVPSFDLASFLCDGVLIYLLYSQLESFKRHLMQSLRDDNSSVCSSPQETVDITTCDQSSVASKASSCGGRTPRIDGKEFFRQARSRLSYEQFGAFLANIKELNAHKQSREETLKKAEEIFGPDNKDLYLSFQGLLNRSMP
nr:unnamed protein product [Digitaria exilis]